MNPARRASSSPTCSHAAPSCTSTPGDRGRARPGGDRRGTVTCRGRGGRRRRPAGPAAPAARRPGAYRPAADGGHRAGARRAGCPARSTAGGATTTRSRTPTVGCSSAAAATASPTGVDPRRRTDRARAGLHRDVAARIAGGPVEVTHRWAASVGFTDDGRPLCARSTDGVIAIGGYNGTGNLVGPVAAAPRWRRVLDGAPLPSWITRRRAGRAAPASGSRTMSQCRPTTEAGDDELARRAAPRAGIGRRRRLHPAPRRVLHRRVELPRRAAGRRLPAARRRGRAALAVARAHGAGHRARRRHVDRRQRGRRRASSLDFSRHLNRVLVGRPGRAHRDRRAGRDPRRHHRRRGAARAAVRPRPVHARPGDHRRLDRQQRLRLARAALRPHRRQRRRARRC